MPEYAFQHPLRVFFNPYDSDEVWVTSFGNSLGFAQALVLPVELMTWKAMPIGDYIELEWRVASEKDFEKYEVEKSTDGHAFSKIATVTPTSQGAGERVYRYDDYEVAPGQDYYYRLKMNDLDGSFTYSGTRHVRLNGGVTAFAIHPNPAKQSTNISLTVSKPLEAVVTIFDEKGIAVYQKQVSLWPGHHAHVLDLEGIPAGVYALQLESGGAV
ncbi:MAG: T9SS type A sorting domain-containing protein [Saprospiraceae bacterium]|nr:T9SS type A sorting domain-containing protein [Saprospiraceae bacterium]